MNSGLPGDAYLCQNQGYLPSIAVDRLSLVALPLFVLLPAPLLVSSRLLS